MAQFTVRNLEDEVKVRLKQRAVRNGTSLEAEVREILRVAVKADGGPVGPGLGSRIASRFARTGLPGPLPELRGQLPQPVALKR